MLNGSSIKDSGGERLQLNPIRRIFGSIKSDDEKTFFNRFPYRSIYLHIVWKNRGEYGCDIFGDAKIVDN